MIVNRLVKVAQEVNGRIEFKKAEISKRSPQVVTGTVVTGDVFVSSAAATLQLWSKLKAQATEMEGAAIGQTCYQQKVPFLIIRSLSDNASNNAHDDVVAFYKTAADNSATLVMAIVSQLN